MIPAVVVAMFSAACRCAAASPIWASPFSKVASPYDVNPLNINPLRGVIADLIDFSKVRACTATKLFIAATNVRSGKIKVFTGPELTADRGARGGRAEAGQELPKNYCFDSFWRLLHKRQMPI